MSYFMSSDGPRDIWDEPRDMGDGPGDIGDGPRDIGDGPRYVPRDGPLCPPTSKV